MKLFIIACLMSVAPMLMADKAGKKIIEVDEKVCGKIKKVEGDVFTVSFTNHSKSSILVYPIGCVVQKKQGDGWILLKGAFRDMRVLTKDKPGPKHILKAGEKREIRFWPADNYHLKPWNKGDTLRLLAMYQALEDGQEVGDRRFARTEVFISQVDYKPR